MDDILKGSFELNLSTGHITYFLTSTQTVKDNHIELVKEYIDNSVINIIVDKRLSAEQRTKIWCILDDFAYCLGGDKEQWREQLQTIFCYMKDLEYFSISELKRDGASKEIASEFIQWLCELAIEQGVGFQEKTRNPIEKRIGMCKPILITSNYSIENLKARYSGIDEFNRLADRIKGACLDVEYKGTSKRNNENSNSWLV